MKLAIGCDHGGFELKKEVLEHLVARGIEVTDVGCNDGASCDYPVYSKKVTDLINSGEVELGILIEARDPNHFQVRAEGEPALLHCNNSDLILLKVLQRIGLAASGTAHYHYGNCHMESSLVCFLPVANVYYKAGGTLAISRDYEPLLRALQQR